jgi:hypothetical protein
MLKAHPVDGLSHQDVRPHIGTTLTLRRADTRRNDAPARRTRALTTPLREPT